MAFREASLTYAQLEARANQLAHVLVRRGVGPEVVVAVEMERSLDLVVAMLAVMKAGGAYLPLDPSYPADRREFMLQDCKAAVVINDRFLADAAPDVSAAPSTPPAVRVDPSNLAYIIYTSGSTGKPKGVLITHDRVVRLMTSTEAWFHFDERDVWTFFHSYAFDFSVWEIWGALMYGGCVVIVPDQARKSPDELLALLAAEKVTVLNQIPSAFRHLIAAATRTPTPPPLALRYVIFGGEALELRSLVPWFERYPTAPRLVNMYGITETTVHVTYRVIDPAECREPKGSPIGIPIPDLEMYVLDAKLNKVGTGAEGEIYVGGAGLARGYHDRPALSAERFIPDPFSGRSGDRLYKTGDVARVLTDGSFEYLGRNDAQVKIRGHRIETGEIGSILATHPAVREAAVVARDVGDGDRRLVAYVSMTSETASDVLREFLAARLPGYMVPSAFVTLAALPITASGKIDFKSLPAPDWDALAQRAHYQAPATEDERIIAALWSKLIGVERIGREDRFFELGGHSLLAAQVAARLSSDYGVSVPVRLFLTSPTVAEAATAFGEARARQGTRVRSELVIPRRTTGERAPLSLAQESIWIHEQVMQDVQRRTRGYIECPALQLRGPVAVPLLERAINEIAARHEIWRTSFALDEDPVQVVGRSARIPVKLFDRRSVAASDRRKELEAVAESLAAQPFVLSRAPLVRAALVTFAPDEHVLLLLQHHLITDAWSENLIAAEVARLYGFLAAGESLPPRTEVETQYADFAAWERDPAREHARDEARAFWRAHLAPVPNPLALPQTGGADSTRPVRLQRALPPALSHQLAAFCRAHNVSQSAVLYAAFATVLAEHASNGRFVLGVASANRTAETERLPGCLSGVLPVVVDVAHAPTLAALAQHVMGRIAEALPYGTLPLPDIARLVGWTKGRLVQVQASTQLAATVYKAGNVEMHQDYIPVNDAKFALEMIVQELADASVSLTWVADAAQLSADTTSAIAAGVEAVLARSLGIAKPAASPVPATRPVPTSDIAGRPLSFAQERLWFLHELAPSDASYNAPFAQRLHGPLDQEVLRRSLELVAQRHDALRTAFRVTDGNPTQVVHPTAGVTLPIVPCAHADLARTVLAEASRPFDLAEPPVRALLVRIAEDDHVFVWSMHHIIVDEQSCDVLWREVTTAYSALVRGETPALPAVAAQYPDYAEQQRARFTPQVLAKHLDAWKKKLAGAATTIDVPRRSGTLASGSPSQFVIDLGSETARAFRELARQTGTTLFVAGLAAARAVIARTTGQYDLCLGAPFSTRNRRPLRDAVGFFVNMLALRTTVDPQRGFAELVRSERDTVLDSFDRADTPLQAIVHALGLARDVGANPLFQVSYTHHPAIAAAVPLGPVQAESYEVTRPGAQFDLELDTWERGESIELHISYKPEVYEAWVIESLGQRFATFLRDALRAPDRPVARIALMDDEERRRVVHAWATPQRELSDLTLPQLFEAQVDRTPDATALVFGDERISYRVLDERANQIAHLLRTRGVGPEVVVGVAIERSASQVAAIIGIVKAGGAWVPMDPSLPHARLRYIADASRARVILTVSEVQRALPDLGISVIAVTAAGEAPIRRAAVTSAADGLAYVLFTSGSTGEPKGVMVTHRAIRNELVVSNEALCPMRPGEALLALAPFTFDQSVHEMWWPLVHGGALVLVAEGEQRDPERVIQRCIEGKVTVLELVPTLLRALVEDGGLARCPTVRIVAAGGEALTLDLMRAFYAAFPRLQLINGYGPTETAVTVCNWRCTPTAAAMVIGKEWSNVQFRILDADGEPVAAGITGELYIAGLQLARGYAARPDLTAERFVPDPFGAQPGGRMYRTGDRVRRLPDGTIEFVGRVDAQVKIRGFRIELGEIEATLLEAAAVSQCVVTVVPSVRGDQLVAYVVPRGSFDVAAMRAHAAARLPHYMVPAAFVALDALPLTPSGKLDRRALPEPTIAVFEREPMIAPRTPEEETIAAIWCQVLGLDEVGIRDDFFARGGHSLLAVQVVTRIRAALGAQLSLEQLFRTKTIEGLAREVAKQPRRDAGLAARSVVVAPRTEPLPLSYSQQRLWLVDQMLPDSSAYHMPSGRRLRGPLDIEALRGAFEDVIRRHEILRTSFPADDGLPRQQIYPAKAFALPIDDLSSLPEAGRATQLARISHEDASARFDLAAGPLLRARVVRLAANDHVLLVTAHHIIFDGWSHDVFWRELSACYDARRHGATPQLAPLQLQYADVALQQRAELSNDQLSQHLAYWKQHLAGAPAETGLPRRRTTGPRGQRELVTTIAADTVRGLRALCERESATVFMSLLAAFRAVIARTTGQDDVVIGTPLARRDRPEVEALIGLFLNTIALRSEVDRDATFAQLVRRERETLLAAYAHQDAPFEMIVEELGVARDPARAPVFQLWFVQESLHPAEAFARDVDDAPFTRSLDASKFDLSVYINEAGEQIELAIVFDTAKFDEAVVDGIQRRLVTALDVAGRSPDRPLVEIELGDAGVDPRSPLPRPEYPAVLDVIEQLANEAPDAPALRHDGQALTRGQLRAAITAIVEALARAGLQPGDRVALAGPPSAGLIAAYLAILRSGVCLVPLSSRLSREHVDKLLDHVGARLVLEVTAGTSRLATRVPIAAVDTISAAITLPPALAPAGPADPAIKYIYFTSGTTGAQKGVIGNLVALGHFSAWQRSMFGETSGPISAQLTELGFDVFLRDTMFALTSGKLMALPPREVADIEPAEMMRWLEREKVTAIHSVPSLARAWLDACPPEIKLPELRCIFFVGEPLDSTLVERWRARFRPDTEIVNLYGTTETGPAKCWFRVPQPPERGIQPIGRALPETQLLVMRSARALAAIGEVGEVVIRTPFSTLGYLDDSGGDAPRFYPNPFRDDPSDRLYRTGDLGRQRPDGAIEILGRADDQVKIRGQRIDPSGIAATLRAHPGIADAAVIAAKLENEVRLIAYAVRGETPPTTAALREHLRQTIPPYMIPTAFVFLKTLPRKPNGKLDRAALPAPDWDAADSDVFVLPRSPEEEAVAAIWREVLGVEKIGIRDNFFALGGHSLVAVLVTSRVRALLDVNVTIQQFFEAPTIEGIAAHIVRARAGTQPSDSPPPIVPVPRRGELPLSFAQQRMWMLHQLAPTSAAYNVALLRRARGPLAVEALRRAFEDVVRRHESLRTVFPSAGGVPLQRIEAPRRWELPVETVAASSGAERERAIDRLIRTEGELPFDLTTGPLLRTKVVRVAGDDHIILVTLHHIISDGWSMGVLWNEVADLYRHYTTGAPLRLAPLPIQYADYAAWQRAWLTGQTLDRELAYWTEQLRDAPTDTALPFKGPRPAVLSARGGMVPITLDAEMSQRLKALNKATRATNFVSLLAAVRAVLARVSGQNDVCIGTPIAGRNRQELEHVIGIMLNTLVLRNPVAPRESFKELVVRERATSLAAYAHQEAPFEMIVDALKVERTLNRTPLFQVSFVHQNMPHSPPPIGDLADQPFVGDSVTTRFDLSIVSLERDGAIVLELVYNLDLFDRWQIEQLAAAIVQFLREALRDPARPIADIPLLTPDERQRLVTTWNRPPDDVARELTVPAMFEAQVDRTPDAAAVIFGDRQLTYRELDERANRIAHALRERGVSPESRVGISLERSPDLVAAILGVSKAGGAWVPLDPHVPAARLEAIAATARPVVVLSARDLEDDALAKFPTTRPAPSGLRPDHLAYVLFTSGSTGQPKGVMIEHRGIVNELISAQTLRAQLGSNDRFLQLAPYTFDLSVHEMLWPLTTGAGVVLVPEGAHREPRRVVEEMQARRVTIMHPVPTLLRALLDEPGLDRCRDLRIMCSGGEALPLDVLRTFTARRPDVMLINSYGPTEASVTVSGWRCPPDATAIAIGQPYLATQMYVLDDRLEPVPLGIAGELYLGGVQLARGYAEQAGQTAATFLPDPFAARPGARMYRTGDRARLWPDGNVEIIGRADRQVKLRGFRIELGEIEATMRQHADISEAAVIVHGSGTDARLVGYYAPATVAADSVRSILAARLPDYMIPRALVAVPAMPLTRSGKLDRNALPPPDDTALRGDTYEAPRTPLEEVLAGIWAELLGVERVSRTANFFDLGGHSLLAARLAWEANTTVAAIFAAPTVAELAAQIESGAEGHAAPRAIAPVPRDQQLPLSAAQQRMWFLHQLAPTSPAYHMSFSRRLRGALDIEALRRAFEELVRRHEGLRSAFPTRDGVPYVAIAPAASWNLPIVELQGDVDRIAREETQRPFDLAAGGLVRTLLVRSAPTEHVLLITMHHIIVDGLSHDLLWRELEELYTARIQARPPVLPELPIQYVDFAHWQRTWLTGDVLERQLAYWEERLRGAPEDTALPFKGPRPPVQTHNGATHSFTLGAELTERVHRLSRERGSTVFITLLAAFRALLFRYTGQGDVCIGAPNANRKQREVEALIGLFLNTIVLRTAITGTTSFNDLVGAERTTALEAFANSDAPLELIIERLHIERSLSRNPLFQVMFQSVVGGGVALSSGFTGLAAESFERSSVATHVDLDAFAVVESDHIDVQLVYNTDLFDAGVIVQMARHFESLLTAALADPDAPLAELAMLDSGERMRLLHAWNGSAQDVTTTSLPALLAERVARTPDAIAVHGRGRSLTYRELAEHAHRLAHHLLSLGIGREERVGICLDRGPDLLIAMLAVLEAGAAYLPLDSELPADRLQYMVSDARVRFVITEPPLRDRVAAEQHVMLDFSAAPLATASSQPPDVAVDRQQLAYVLYTSGSTGRPKGVQIQHASLVNFLESMLAAPGMTARDTLLAVTTASFDISGLELYLPLLAGGRVVIASRDDARNGSRLLQLLADSRATIMQATPATWRLLVELGWQPAPGFTALCGGEALPPDLAASLVKGGGTLWNLYGPTETTIWSARERIRAGSPIRLGEPIANTQLYILDRATAEPQPLEVPGELYIAGDGLARGYGDRPDLTAERFVPDPFASAAGARMYRTGDLARRRIDGTIEFLGRIDHQVKLRGFRIELGEIEAVLAEHPSVAEVVTVVREDGGDARLVAYVVPIGTPPAVDALLALARSRLPDYMVPTAAVFLDELPLSAAGKVDRRALPAPERSAFDAARYEAPRGPIEEIVASLWADMLGVKRVGIHDDFFDVGGHSLLAVRLVWAIQHNFQIDLPLERLFMGPTVAELAAAIEAAQRDVGASALPPIARTEQTDDVPLSYSQERMWFLHELDPSSPAYNIAMGLRLRGGLDTEALRRAFEATVARHATLRTTFPAERGIPRQRVLDVPHWELPIEDLSHVNASERDAELDRRSREEGRHAFALATELPFRTRLLRFAPDDHVVFATMHHIVTDGWSLDLFWRDVQLHYKAFTSGAQPSLAPLAIQYTDYAAWQRRWLSGDVLAEQLAFWKGRLADAPRELALPLKGPRPPHQTFVGDTVTLVLERELGSCITALARRQGATVVMALLAAFRALLYRYTGQHDVCIGVPTANRKLREVEQLVGLFVNTIVVRSEVSPHASFAELLARERNAALAAYAHQDAPLEMVIDSLSIERMLDRNPLFQVLFQVMFEQGETVAAEADWATARASVVERPKGSTQLDLDVSGVVREDGAIQLAFLYNVDLFDRATIEQMTRHFQRLLAQVVADPRRSLASLDLLENDEHAKLRAWNSTTVPVDEPQLVHELVAQQAARTPEAIAVEHAGVGVSYRELAARIDRVAGWLTAHGVRRGDRVTVCVDRSTDMVIALLAVLRAGAAYVPIDPEYPAQRRDLMRTDAGAVLEITDATLRDALASSNPPPPVTGVGPDDVAYVLYTSGSTGTPKGVGVPHRAVVNFLHAMRRAPGIAPSDTLVAVTTLSFDIAGLELYLPLVTGAKVVIASRDTTRDGHLLARLLDASAATIVQATPATWRMLLAAGWSPPTHLRVLCGGEALPPDLAASLAATAGALWNLYGPTETTIWSTVARVEPGQPITIGRPIDNTFIYVLDDSLQPTPIGVAGELYIGGRGVALGYHDRPALTAERFVPDPFADPGARMYKTGDRARWRVDGTLEHLGRIDTQVKLRGFRIELGEIEAALRVTPGITDTVVVVREDAPGQQQLVAYVVSPGEIDRDALRTALASTLPDYMVPSVIVALPALPLTPNGKLDRKALPAPSQAPHAEHVAPRTLMEHTLEQIWRDVLGVERVGVHDDFFALGGQSLLATRVTAAIRQTIGVELPVRTIFQASTLASLSRAVIAMRDASSSSETVPLPVLQASPRGERPPLSFAQQRLWFLHQLEPDSPSYQLAHRRRLPHLDAESLRRAFETVVHRHESLRTTFPAPGGEPYQLVHSPTEWMLDIVDARALDATARETELGRIEAAHRRPFDLSTGPLLRTNLVRIADDEDLLFVTLHHIITDGWSQDIFWREVWTAYDALAAGQSPALPTLPVQYVDYAMWQRTWLAGAELDRQVGYWTERLRGAPEETALPFKGPRPPAQTFGGRVLSLDFDAATSRRVRALARAHGVTLFMLFAAAIRTLLARYTGQRDVLLGTAITNRSARELEGLIGMFVNTLVLRNELDSNDTFTSILAREKAFALAAYDHQYTPFELVVDALGVERSLSRPPVFQVMYIHQGELGADRRGTRVADVDELTLAFDIALESWEQGDLLGVDLVYNVDLFERPLIEQMARHFVRLLDHLTSQPAQRVNTVELLDAEERHRLLAASQATDAASARSSCMHELFEAQVDITPDAVAIQVANASLTYRELDVRANQLAHHLRILGVGPEVRVALCMHRSPDALVGVLGILKAGGAYVPIEPTTPSERIAFMVEDSGCSLAIVDADLVDHVTRPGLRLVSIDAGAIAQQPGRRLPRTAFPANLAYVIYTSGSTGRPKGVMIEHGMAVNVVLGMGEREQITPRDRVLQFASFAFDLSVQDIFVALSRGATIVMRGDDIPSAAELLAPPFAGVTVLNLPAAYWHTLAAAGPPPPSVRLVGIGGERPSPVHVRAWSELAPACVLLNCYGPTEATITATVEQLRSEALAGNEVPIGRPLPNYAAYVLDAQLQMLPPGVAGELYLGGAGIARGYLDRSALTAERFVPNPFANGRLYRTGDLVRWRLDGTLEFLGRIDHQVKVRGYRIELGEIESVLGADPSLEQAVVVARNGRLIAYVVPREGFDASAARARIGTQLPDYMVPSAFVTLDGLPLNASGKVDRKALPAAEDTRDEYVAPQTPEQQLLANIWQDVLGVTQVGLHDNFFALGGHSLLAIRLIVDIERVFAVKISLRDVFTEATLGALAARLRTVRGADAGTERPQLYASDTNRTPLPAALRGVFKLERSRTSHSLNRHVSSFWIDGRIDLRALERALNAMRVRHTVLRSRFFLDGDREMLEVLDVADAERFVLLQHVDLTAYSGVELEHADAAFHKQTAARPLDIGTGEVLAAGLSSLSATRHHFTVVIHNIASDADTMAVFVDELCALWRALTEEPDREAATVLPPVPLQYHHLADYLDRLASSDAGREQRAYWRDRLEGLQPLELPVDVPRDRVDALRDANAGIVSFPAGWAAGAIEKDLLALVERVAKDQRVSVLSTLLAALAAYLSQRTSQRDLAFVTRLSHRYLPSLQRTLGFLVNPLVLRVSTDGEPPFSELVRRAQTAVTNAFDNGDCDMFAVTSPRAFRFCIDYSKFPFASTGASSLHLPSGVAVTRAPNPNPDEARIGYDLILWVGHYSERMALQLVYNRELFLDASAEAFLESFLERLPALCLDADPEHRPQGGS